MGKQEKESLPTPPYVAYKTLKNFLRTLSQAVPSRIDKSVMRSLSGGAQSQIIQALKYLRLIDVEGKPADKLTQLVKSEGAEYQKVLREVITAAYPFLASKSLNLESATMHLLEEEFQKLASGETVRKCITFFIPAAKDAGIPISPFIEKPAKRPASNNKNKKPRGSVEKAPLTGNVVITPAVPQTSVLSWHELLLSKFPSFDPSWPDDVKAKWFDSFTDLMKRGDKA